MNRVVLTGIGVVSSIGIGAEEFAAGLRAGRSGARPISVFDTTGFEHANGCEVVGFDPSRWLRDLDPSTMGKASQFSVAAARMAVADAGLAGQLTDKRGLVTVGTTDGESFDLDRLVETEVEDGPEAMDGAGARRVPAPLLSLSIARELRLGNVSAYTIATACSAGNYAIGDGFDAVRSGEVDFALCGGADAMCRKTFAGFYRLGTIAPEFCQPFDVDRKGILTGEGAGMLVLESLDSAVRRGARIYAEVLGYGLNCDAYHQVAPNQSSIERCMRLALDDAGVKPHEVDLISAHGTGTKANDITETRAIRQVYGDRPPRTISVKSMLGHTMGAASALGTIACALAITHGFVPPTINHRVTDPECEIDCVPNESVAADLRVVQNNGMAFAGNNASVILGKYTPGEPAVNGLAPVAVNPAAADPRPADNRSEVKR
ncbi:beta-ketoacyl-[acyl-carrier-protein] synthase family protein [Goodfellowiella coeruleoviolacea]|uniref:3-oxoacyl-[acyl-carrier-protein] synthase II n=1 Tax=Goodfellowiella coeruleoviolacea TaxID=334858 RepID=A0AAE3G9H3_9PSEU|nr:beta-ketoacyl-[acyl-carrier-protein] synthase family protein [Goodfellowiella coeruleoviolacea]MCP2163197.1 3-oxoacyl-[acyl-carrier-protein] synthase II [Goodfellowiella coeruleoviolacea]